MKGLLSLKRGIALLIVCSCLLVPSFAETTDKLQAGFSQLEVMIQEIKANYYRDVTDEELINAMYKGLFDALDPHSDYFTPAEYKDFTSSLEGSFSGVGISIAPKDGYLEVIAPIKGSPAFSAGIKPGDIVTAVDGKDIKGLASDVVVGMIRGEAGKSITLTINRSGEKAPLIFKLVRAIIVIQSVEHKVVSGVDVISITSWDQNTTTQLKAVLAKLTLAKGVVIDLRNNPGGLLDQVVTISDMFLPKGMPIVSIDYNKTADSSFVSTYQGLTAPMVVLVNGGSASASEIFAAAMQENKRGKVVGTKSYGKGTVQGLFALPDNGAMKLTMAKYLTPSGKSVHGVGVIPDVILENTNEAETVVAKFLPLSGLDTFKRGSKSIEVKSAQQRLKYLGYDVVIDGLFGTKMEAALKTFQKSKGLGATGFLDEGAKVALSEAAIAKGKTVVVDKQLAYAVDQLKK